MSLWQALLLGLIQGATEFLPVSSSGHLVLAEHFLHLTPSLAFGAALHGGTLVAVVAYYRRDLWAMIRGVGTSAAGLLGDRSLAAVWREDSATRLALLITLATVPTGIIGLALKGPVERAMQGGAATCAALIVTGLLLTLTRLDRASRGDAASGADDDATGADDDATDADAASDADAATDDNDDATDADAASDDDATGADDDATGAVSSATPEPSASTRRAALPGGPTSITVTMALLIGVAQGIAVFPGISRSGATLVAALLCGVTRADAARFAFLLSVPAILGALVLEGHELLALGHASLGPVLLGVLTAVVMGYLSLAFLVRIIQRGGLHRFTYYVVPVGIAGLIYFLA